MHNKLPCWISLGNNCCLLVRNFVLRWIKTAGFAEHSSETCECVTNKYHFLCLIPKRLSAVLLIRGYLGAAEYICTQKDPRWLLKLHNNFLIHHSIGSLAWLRLNNGHRVSICFTFAGGGSCCCGVSVAVC